MVDRVWTAGRSTDRLLALACSGLFLGILLVHSVMAPTYRGPDEPQHFDLVREWSMDHDYDVVSRQLSQQVANSLRLVEFHTRSRNLEQSAAMARSDRPRLDQLGPDRPSEAYNQISQHGPLYPVLVGTLVDVVDLVEPGPRWSYDREVGVARLLTVLVLVPVPALVFYAARRLGASRPAAVVAALVPSISPQLTHIGAMVNNDNLQTALAALVLALLARVLVVEDRRRREDWAVGFATGLLLLTKAFAVVVCIAVGLAYLSRWWRWRPPWREVFRQGLVVGTSMFAAGGWWYVRNVVADGALQPKGEPLLPPAPEGFEPDPSRWFDEFTTRLPLRFFGDFGWFDVHIGAGWVGASLVVIVLGLVGALLPPARRRTLRPSWTLLLLVPLLVTLAVTALNTWKGYERSGVFPGIQGRYLFIAVPFVAVVVAVGWTRLVGPAARVVPLAALAAVVAFQLEGMTTMLEYYWGPPGGTLRDQVAAMVTWSPWPRAVTAAFLVSPVIAVGALLVLTMRSLFDTDPANAQAEVTSRSGG